MRSMIRDWLYKITLIIVALGVFLLFYGLWLHWSRPSTIPPKQPIEEKSKLPERHFKMKEEEYNYIGEPVLALKKSTVSLQLPDLRQQLAYYGKNGRPDALEKQVLLNFGLPGSKSIATIAPGEKLYLSYDRSQKPPKFIFSPNNEKSSLWIEAAPQGNEANVHVKMTNETGKIIQTPQANANFLLKEKDQTRVGKSWDIGKWRVDATLLSRQKARWYGRDVFLETHGGEEYADTIGKERIDFTDEENPYSVFVKEGDFLIWTDNHWRSPTPGEDTTRFPLMVAKKVSDRVMNLELWDVEGKQKINLNLLKSAEMKIPSGIQQNFKFVGAKTRSQFIFEINKERMTLKPKDWLLMTKKGWIKLTTPEQIDDYVNRKITGPLFVFDGVIKKGDTQIISGTMYNASRTEMQPIELPIQQSRAVGGPEASPEGKQEQNKPPVPPGQPPVERHSENERPPPMPVERPMPNHEKTPFKE
jgi:hypothetical protein